MMLHNIQCMYINVLFGPMGNHSNLSIIILKASSTRLWKSCVVDWISWYLLRHPVTHIGIWVQSWLKFPRERNNCQLDHVLLRKSIHVSMSIQCLPHPESEDRSAELTFNSVVKVCLLFPMEDGGCDFLPLRGNSHVEEMF